MAGFATKLLAAKPEAIAPDGSEVRLLCALARGGMAHFQLAAGATAKAVRHRTVEEIWYFLSGRGEMWREQDGKAETIAVEPGTSLTIPLGTTFQFRAFADAPLAAIGITMPPWPGAGEAVIVEGAWEPTVG